MRKGPRQGRGPRAVITGFFKLELLDTGQVTVIRSLGDLDGTLHAAGLQGRDVSVPVGLDVQSAADKLGGLLLHDGADVSIQAARSVDSSWVRVTEEGRRQSSLNSLHTS